ncbi:MAG: hypothetical protein IPM82_11390 [Saprospiraceae bacterium]|nr:hypothetical protein [Saprospiraceae bacterium]
MSNTILDAPEYSFDEIRKNLMKGGLTQVYEKQGELIVKKDDYVRVKIRRTVNGQEVVPMWAPIGNGAQAIFSIALIFTLRFFRIPYFFLIGILLGLTASYFYYLPKCNKLKDEVERLMGGGIQV